jgi:hypothetical protein
MRVHLIAAALAASALLSPAEAADTYANIHTVAVVSAMGDGAGMHLRGHTIFGNQNSTLHTDWQLDAHIAARLRALLGTRFKVSDVALDTSALTAREPSGFNGAWSGLQAWVKAQPASNAVDAYVVVVPDSMPVEYPENRGVQVVHDLLSLHEDVTAVMVFYRIGVYDAKTGERIGQGEARYPDSGTISGYSPPIVHCGNAMWADTADAMTPAQKAMLRQEVQSLTDRSLGYALSDAGLIDDAAAAADARTAPAGEATCKAFF